MELYLVTITEKFMFIQVSLKEKHFRIYVSYISKIASVARKIFKLLYPIESSKLYVTTRLKKYMRNKKNQAESKAKSRLVRLVSLF